MALSIASAFRLRNKLKEKIKKLTNLTESADVTTPKGTPENTAVFDGKSFVETISAVSLLMETLRDFNIAIDKANAVNKEDLITLESLKAEIAFYDEIARKVRRAEKYFYENNPAGGKDKIELEPVLDQKTVVSRFENLKKKKDEIEDRLANSNFSVQVDFDQNIINRLL
jgi:hypothetical protein